MRAASSFGSPSLSSGCSRRAFACSDPSLCDPVTRPPGLWFRSVAPRSFGSWACRLAQTSDRRREPRVWRRCAAEKQVSSSWRTPKYAMRQTKSTGRPAARTCWSGIARIGRSNWCSSASSCWPGWGTGRSTTTTTAPRRGSVAGCSWRCPWRSCSTAPARFPLRYNVPPPVPAQPMAQLQVRAQLDRAHDSNRSSRLPLKNRSNMATAME